MEEIIFDQKRETIPEIFDISKERMDELHYALDVYMHKLLTPNGAGYIELKPGEVIEYFISHAKDEKERIYLSFIAGCRCTRIRFDLE